MFIKIVSLTKVDTDYRIESTRVIECDEYVKTYQKIEGESDISKHPLLLEIFHKNVRVREILFNDILKPVDIFIENSKGDTVGRLKYPIRP